MINVHPNFNLSPPSGASGRIIRQPCASLLSIMASATTTAALAKVMVERVGAGERLCDVALDVHRSSGHSQSSLLSDFRRARLGTPHVHGKSILTAAQDEALVYTAQVLSYANAALSRTALAALVKNLWGKEVGQTWARDLVGRHNKELSTRTCKALTDKRNAASVFDQVVDWVSQLEEFFKNHPLPPHAILNYEEFRLVMNLRATMQ